MTIAEQLATFAAGVRYETLPPEVAVSVKQRVLDTVGICLASSSAGLADGVADVAELWAGKPEASVMGSSARYPAPTAALVNGTLAHSLDFDDTHLPSILHPSASIVPAVLALGQACRTSGKDAIAAAAVGIELTVRTGMGGYLPDAGNIFFEKGWHATSICGTLGSAAAGAKLLGLGADGIGHAVAIAASMSAGVIEANRAGGTVKRLHCGWAAHAGLTAALLAQRGFTGPPTVFEGRFGFYRAFLDGRFDEANILDGLGQRWELPGIFFKPYPANHYTHASVDAVLELKRKYALDPAQITDVELRAPAAVLRTIGEPREEKIRPRGGYHAQFSGPFVVATAFLGGGGLGVYLDDFTDELVRDPARLALAAKVRTVPDAECDAIFPRQFPTILRVSMDGGQTYEARVLANRGGPDRPLSDDELRLKFRLNATRALPASQAVELASAIGKLDGLPNLDAILGLAARA